MIPEVLDHEVDSSCNDVLKKAIKGDASSITAIVKQYTPLVHKIVNKYSWMSPGHSREDLVQEGLIGVVKAINTFDISRGTAFMTWAYPQVRGAVQNLARKEERRPKYHVPTYNADFCRHFEDPHVFEIEDGIASEKIREVIETACGSTETLRAQIVCDRFGLLGRTAMRQGEVAKKYNLSKQAINSHITRFSKAVRDKHPELKEWI